MQRNITTVLLLFAALTSATCQNPIASAQTFTVHAEIMSVTHSDPAPAPLAIKAARNIAIGTESVYAYYDNAEFILKYCGEVYIELDGKPRENIPAKVFQLEPGVWVAEIDGGQYVKVFAETGTTNIDVDGQFRVFTRN